MNKIDIIKHNGYDWIDKHILQNKLTYTTPGSIAYLLHGEKVSIQSISIKMGYYGEALSKDLIKTNNNLELLKCGIQKVNSKNKDVDLAFKNEMNKTIYYRELKGNIDLDTEKLPATIAKCKEIELSFTTKYPEYKIDCGVLNWSVYNRKILPIKLINKIKMFESSGIKIDHMEDLLHIVGDIEWSEEEYYSYFREIEKKINTN
jgi:hypothetical protein